MNEYKLILTYHKYINIHRRSKISESFTNIEHYLNECNLVEQETLNGVSPSGSCQFSSISYKLFGQLCTHDYRPDLLLRRIALLAIECNPDLYQSFLLSANAKTRRQQALGGAGVNLKRYIKSMKDPRCDGDAVTLQAIADALKVTVCVITFLPRNNHVVVHRVEPREIRLGDSSTEAKIIPKGPHHGVWISLRGEAHYRSLHLAEEKVTDTPRSTRHFSNIVVAMEKLKSILSSFEKLREEIEAQNRFEAHEIVCGMCFKPHVTKKRSSSCDDEEEEDDEDGEDYDREKGKVWWCWENFALFLYLCLSLTHTHTHITLFRLTHSRARHNSQINSCNHTFHIACLMKWSKTSNACPVCRKRFSSIEKAGDEKCIPSSNGRRSRSSKSSSFCILCGQRNRQDNLMLCDGYCGTACHAFCLGLDAIPEGDWFCQKCSKRRRSRRQSALSSRRRASPIKTSSSSSSSSKRFNVTPQVVEDYCRGLEIDTVPMYSSGEGKEEKTSTSSSLFKRPSRRGRNVTSTIATTTTTISTSSTSSEEDRPSSPRSAKRRKSMIRRASKLLSDMNKAAKSDEKSYEKHDLIPVQKNNMWESVHLNLSESREMSTILLDQGLLRVLQRWMRPHKDGKVLMSNETREHLLQLILEMPVKFKHIQSSNSFGKLLMHFVESDRDLVHQIVIKWSHLTVHKSECDNLDLEIAMNDDDS